MTQKFLFSTLLIFTSFIQAFSQLYVNSTGQVGIGSQASLSKVEIFDNSSKIYLYPDINGSVIGTNDKQVNFYSFQTWAYYPVYASKFAIGSDIRLKENVRNIDGSLSLITKLQGKKYNLKAEATDKNGKKRETYGFIAQEVEKIIPEMIETGRDSLKCIDYIAVIPLLVEALKEQQQMIEQQATEIAVLKNKVATTNKQKSLPVQETNEQPAMLYQNNPNPFSETTTIRYNIPSNASNAIIYIFNTQGVKVKEISITARGQNQSQINAGELLAGVYFYTLIIDSQAIDTKQMIITK